MAQGDITVFDEAIKNIGNNSIDLSNTSGFSIMLITTLPTANDATPDTSDYTEVSGTGYAAVSLTTSWVEAAGVSTFDSSVNPSWAQNAGGPTNVVAALIYRTAAGAEDALCFIDLTTDGGATAISLVDAPINIDFSASGIFTVAAA